jgi:hypothetical protein
MAKFSPVKAGYDPRKDEKGGGGWLTIKGGEAVDVTVLVEAKDILACEQCAIWLDEGTSPVWVYTGPDDPSHDLGVEKRYRAYLPVLVEGEPKIWSMGKQAHGQILDVADAGGSIKGAIIRIKRTGEGLKTRYSIVPRGKKSDVSKVEEVDVIAQLGPLDPEEVKEMIAKRFGHEDYETFLAASRGKKLGRGSKGVAKTRVGEEDEIEDLELT